MRAMGHLLSGQERACTLLGCTRLKNALHYATLSSDEIKSTGQRQQLEKRMKCAKQRRRGCKEIFRDSSKPPVWITDTENCRSLCVSNRSVSALLSKVLTICFFFIAGPFTLLLKMFLRNITWPREVPGRSDLPSAMNHESWFMILDTIWHLLQDHVGGEYMPFTAWF